MINVKVFKIQTTGWVCDNPNCKHNLKYHNHIIGTAYHIKPDTIAASVALSGYTEIYCRDCIDEVYKLIKSNLDSNLWIFQ